MCCPNFDWKQAKITTFYAVICDIEMKHYKTQPFTSEEGGNLVILNWMIVY